MTLEAGTQLGSFEITGKIGAGGMGEVYRATDTKLGRDVAIKTLPAALADDKDRLARFEREAKLLASLNHAHIASVYNLDEHDGTLYIAMELVEGETLEERLRKGALPVDDALQLGLQIALALEAAHEKGVVHRDLKPANIMITPDGVVKVLDFGLAKAFSVNPDEASPAQSPALSVAMTQQGLILGTAGYMSPEQASGQATDQRADIWSFGVVLYEMLSGMPVFSGESVPHVLADVLKSEPDWERLPKNLPWRVRETLERCLIKKPRSRMHSIADARIQIETALSEPDRLPAGVVAQTAATPSRRTVLAVGAGAIVAGIGLRHLANPLLGETPDAELIIRFPISLPGDVPAFRRNRTAVAISPDGRTVVFSTPQGIYRRNMDEIEPVLISGSEPDSDLPALSVLAVTDALFFSPEGDSIAFAQTNSEGSTDLVSSPLNGGPVRRITELEPGSLFMGGSWGKDERIYYATQQGVFSVADRGGPPMTVVEAAPNQLYRRPQLLPDGDSILVAFTEGTTFGSDLDEQTQVSVLSLTTGDRSPLFDNGGEAVYVAPGFIVFAQRNELFGIAFDPDSLTVTGDRVPLQQGVASGARFDPYRNKKYAFSENGTLAYVEGETPVRVAEGRNVVLVDQAGNESPIPSTAGRSWNTVSMSPDGRRMAMADLPAIGPGQDTSGGIWIADAERPVPVEVFSVSGGVSYVHWIDNQRVAFNLESTAELALMSVDRSEDPTLLSIPNAQWAVVSGTTPDGSGMVVTYLPLDSDFDPELEGHQIGLMRIDADANGEHPIEPLIAHTGGARNGKIRPDGEWIVYEGGLFPTQIYIERFPGGGDWRVVSDADGGVGPLWSADGDAIFYRNSEAMNKVTIQRSPSLEIVGNPEPMFAASRQNFPFGTTGPGQSWRMTLDQQFLMIQTTLPTINASDPQIDIETSAEAAAGIVVVQGFGELLRRNVRAN